MSPSALVDTRPKGLYATNEHLVRSVRDRRERAFVSYSAQEELEGLGCVRKDQVIVPLSDRRKRVKFHVSPWGGGGQESTTTSTQSVRATGNTESRERGRWQPPRALSHSRTASDLQTAAAAAATASLARILFVFSSQHPGHFYVGVGH